MSTQGIIIINILGLGLIVTILNLLRKHKLYVGYAAIWSIAVVGLMLMISIPALLSLVTRAVGAIFPASALSLLAFVFIFVMLLFITVQISRLSSRQIQLIQLMALKDLQDQKDKTDT